MKHKRGRRLHVNTESVKIEPVGTAAPEPMSADELRAVNRPYFDEIAKLAGADVADRALRIFVKETHEATCDEDRLERRVMIGEYTPPS
jgi:hypothetical protein